MLAEGIMEAQWINSAVIALNLSQEDIQELPADESKKLKASIKRIFLDVADPRVVMPLLADLLMNSEANMQLMYNPRSVGLIVLSTAKNQLHSGHNRALWILGDLNG